MFFDFDLEGLKSLVDLQATVPTHDKTVFQPIEANLFSDREQMFI